MRTTCPYCGIVATLDGLGGAAIAGNATHFANAGRLCSKGSALGETLALEARPELPDHAAVKGFALRLGGRLEARTTMFRPLSFAR